MSWRLKAEARRLEAEVNREVRRLEVEKAKLLEVRRIKKFDV